MSTKPILRLKPTAGRYVAHVYASDGVYLYGKAGGALGSAGRRWDLNCQNDVDIWTLPDSAWMIGDAMAFEDLPGVVFYLVEKEYDLWSLYRSDTYGEDPVNVLDFGADYRADGSQLPQIHILSRGICHVPEADLLLLGEYSVSDTAGVSGTDIGFTAATKTIASTTTDLQYFKPGDPITVSGSTSNNGDLTVATVVGANALTVDETLVDEAAGASVSITFDRVDAAGEDKLRIYQSDDQGATWTPIMTFNVGTHNFRHIHAIRYNSYNHRVYVFVGDNDTDAGIFSFDPLNVPAIDNTDVVDIGAIDGADSVDESNQAVRWVDAVFDERYLYGPNDAADMPGIWRLRHDLTDLRRIHEAHGAQPEPSNRTGWNCVQVDDQLICHDVHVETPKEAIGFWINFYAARIQDNGVAGPWVRLATMSVAATRGGIVRGNGLFAIDGTLYVHTAGAATHDKIDCTYIYTLDDEFIDADLPDVIAPVLFVDYDNGSNTRDGKSSVDDGTYGPVASLSHLLNGSQQKLTYGCRVMVLNAGTYTDNDGALAALNNYANASFAGETGLRVQVTGQGRDQTRLKRTAFYGSWLRADHNDFALQLEKIHLDLDLVGSTFNFPIAASDQYLWVLDAILDGYDVDAYLINWRPLLGALSLRRSMFITYGTVGGTKEIIHGLNGTAGEPSVDARACIFVGPHRTISESRLGKYTFLHCTLYGHNSASTGALRHGTPGPGIEPTLMNSLCAGLDGSDTDWWDVAGHRPDGLGNHQDWNILCLGSDSSAHEGPNDRVALDTAAEVLTTPTLIGTDADFTPQGAAIGYCRYRPVSHDYNRVPFNRAAPSAGAIEGDPETSEQRPATAGDRPTT